VGLALGAAVGDTEGAAVGLAVGLALGAAVGTLLGLADGVAVGARVGAALGAAVGDAEGDSVGFAVPHSPHKAGHAGLATLSSPKPEGHPSKKAIRQNDGSNLLGSPKQLRHLQTTKQMTLLVGGRL
jgi:phage-related tail protein